MVMHGNSEKVGFWIEVHDIRLSESEEIVFSHADSTGIIVNKIEATLSQISDKDVLKAKVEEYIKSLN